MCLSAWKQLPSHQREKRLRQWRYSRIRRITEIQKQKREWINFKEIGEWCSEEDCSIKSNEEKRALAFEKLKADLLFGDFEKDGHSFVRHLNPDRSEPRIYRQQFEKIVRDFEPGVVINAYLSYFWIPRRVFEKWLKKHRLEGSPFRFRPQRQSAALKKTGRGVAGESLAAKKLGLHMQTHRDLKRADAKTWLKEQQNFEAGTRSFARIWRNARVAAGLQSKAAPGRKKKS